MTAADLVPPHKVPAGKRQHPEEAARDTDTQGHLCEVGGGSQWQWRCQIPPTNLVLSAALHSYPLTPIPNIFQSPLCPKQETRSVSLSEGDLGEEAKRDH